MMKKILLLSTVIAVSISLSGCGGGKIGEKSQLDYSEVDVDSLLARPEKFIGKPIEIELSYLDKKVYRKSRKAIWAVRDSYDIDILVRKDEPIYDAFTMTDIEHDDAITVYGKPYLYSNSDNIFIIPDEIIY